MTNEETTLGQDQTEDTGPIYGPEEKEILGKLASIRYEAMEAYEELVVEDGYDERLVFAVLMMQVKQGFREMERRHNLRQDET